MRGGFKPFSSFVKGRQGFFLYRMHHILRNLYQRFHHKVSFCHQRMGDGEFRSLQHEVIVQQDVDVNQPVAIDTVDGFFRSSQLFFDFLGGVQQFQRSELGFQANGCVEEAI